MENFYSRNFPEIPDENYRRPLLLIAKTLTNLASGVEFAKKEPYMIPINQFITANLKKISNLFESYGVKKN